MDNSYFYRAGAASTPPSAAPATHNSKQPSPSEYIPKALCVDADEATQAVFRQALAGFEVVFASGAYEAIRSVTAQRFDVYVIEYWLHDWNGVALCRDIRSSDPNVPICFCSLTGTPEAQRRAKRAGATAFFVKPPNAQHIRGELVALMKLRDLRNKAASAAALQAAVSEMSRRAEKLCSDRLMKSVEQTLERVCRKLASEAFLHAGGTLAAFERTWNDLWTRAFRPHTASGAQGDPRKSTSSPAAVGVMT